MGKDSIFRVGKITQKDPGPKGRVKKKGSRSWLGRKAVEEMNDQGEQLKDYVKELMTVVGIS